MVSSPAINKSMTPFEWGLVIGLSIVWGGSFFFNAIAVKELPTWLSILIEYEDETTTPLRFTVEKEEHEFDITLEMGEDAGDDDDDGDDD